MNDVRKQIIALIEPYMDKTPSFGVLYYSKEDGYNQAYGDIIKMDKRIYKILGHYDITAVFKYIERTDKYDILPTVWLNRQVIQLLGLGCEIPNKPLHLYTEKEDKNLLELLQKLGTQK